MPNLVAIFQATAKINRGAESAPPGIECFKSPRSDRVKSLILVMGMKVGIEVSFGSLKHFDTADRMQTSSHCK